MSVVSEIIARLAAAGTPFGAVSGAADLASIEDSPLARPTAYVITVEEASAENERLGDEVLQRSESDIAIVLVTENLGDVAMGDAASDIETLKAWERRQLLGFEPPSAEEPMTHVGGKLLKARAGTVWFEDTFAVVTYLESQS